MSCLSRQYNPRDIVLKLLLFLYNYPSQWLCLKHYPKVTKYFHFPWNYLMPAENFLGPTKAITLKILANKQSTFYHLSNTSNILCLQFESLLCWIALNNELSRCHLYFSSGGRHGIAGISFWSVCSMYFYHSCSGKLTAFPPVTLPHAFHVRSVTIQTNHL